MLQVEHLPRQRYRVRSGLGLVVRIIGLSLVGLGFWIGVIPLISNFVDWLLGEITTNAVIELLPGTMIGILVGIPLLCTGWAMAFLRHSVEIDLVENRVTETNDFLIWKRQKGYPLAHVRRVLLNSTATRGRDTTRYYVNALIEMREALVSVASEPARREQEVRDVANELAEILRVELNSEDLE